MATSLVDRINRVGNGSAQKNVYDWYGLGSFAGVDSRNRDFTHSEYGAAQASTLLVEIDSALQVWEQWLDGLVWDIKDINTGNVLLSSDIRVVPDGAPGARLLRAIQKFRQIYKHSYWKSLALSDWIVGETYLYRVPNPKQIPSDLQWLNPLTTEPDIRQGKIVGYRYSATDSTLIGYTIPKEMVAYRMLRRNIFNDLRGRSPVLSIIDEANLSRNVKRAFRNYFRNGMILGGVIMPEGEKVLGEYEHRRASDEIERSLSGTDNAHRWAILQKRMVIEQFQTKDAAKDLNALDILRKPIMMALGVPEELAGLTGDKTYENVEQARRAWWTMRAIPYARDVAEYHNNQIVPYLEPGSKIYIEPQTDKYEIEDPGVVSQDVNTGIIDLTQAAQKRGYEPDKDLKDIRIIGGQPYSKDRLLREANGVAAEIQVSVSDNDNTSSPGQVLGDVPTKEVFGYHIDSGVVTVNEARAQIGLKPLPAQQGNQLQDLQSKFAVMVTASQAGIPTEVAAQMVGLDIPQIDPPALPAPTAPIPSDAPPVGDNQADSEVDNPFQSKHIVFDDHHVWIAPFEPSQPTAIDEVEAWRKVATRSAKSALKFVPDWLRGDIADNIFAALELATDKKSIHGIFDTSSSIFDTYQKAIQATRLDFEGDFDELLKRARDEKMGRVQWASAMRSIIRRYGKRAFEDGLVAGGVLDGVPSEEDENKIAELVANASRYVTKLGKELYKGDGISDAVADNKAAIWWSRTMQVFFDEGRLSADGNGMYEFAGTDGEESCRTCTRLKGQRHRLKDWSRRGLRPGVDGDNFECGGFHCEHKLVKVQAKARGKF